jgi:hypothetical protein
VKGARPPLGAQTSHHTPHAWCVVRFVFWWFLVEETTVTEPEDSITAEPEGEAASPVTAPVRRRAPGADPAVRSFGAARTCAAEGCETRLSRYNPDSYCSVHRGWDRQVTTRRRRGDDEQS